MGTAHQVPSVPQRGWMGGVPSPEVSYSGSPSGSTVMQQSVRRGILKLDPGQLIIRARPWTSDNCRGALSEVLRV